MSHALVNESPVTELTLWGFGARAMHAARWRSRGVQVVHHGSDFKAALGAELYLLLEHDQMVLFDLAQLGEAMVWNQAFATRVQIVESVSDSVREDVIADENGIVQRIQRTYSPRGTKERRVLLTRSPAAAAAWAHAGSRREAWVAVRSAARGRLASERVRGVCIELGSGGEAPLVRLLQRLVATWGDPDRAIEGLEEIEPGIWAVAGTRLKDDAICTPPAWIGYAPHSGRDRMLAGPAWSIDDETVVPGSVPVRLRLINEIMPPAHSAYASTMPTRQLYGLVKRSIDLLVSALVLVVSLPLMILVALAIVLDGGWPLFFGHERQGRDGVNFKCWKFRTMRRDAESMVEELQALNRADGPQVFIEDDPRVTRVGRVLRKIHLDEIPQFWNVLRGEMSLVGPRPSPDKENQFCPAWREIRLSVRPGITGLWQVERTRAEGRDFQEWIQYDIEYVRHTNTMRDLWICIKTLRNILSRGN